MYTGYHDTSEIEHGLCACAKAWELSLRTGTQTILCLLLVIDFVLLTLTVYFQGYFFVKSVLS